MTPARPPEAKASAKYVFINHERKLEDRRRSDTALVLTVNDINHQSARSTLVSRRELRYMYLVSLSRYSAGSAGSSLFTGNQSLWVPGGVWLQS